MDEASGLIADLQSKLKELDDKVKLYTKDMALEFDKYVESLLEDVPEEISSSVTEALAECLKDFPHLESSRQDCARVSSLPASSNPGSSAKASAKLPPGSITISEIVEPQSEVPRSPHARESEFAGVFTQSFIPLLDSTDRNERRASSDASPSISIAAKSPRNLRSADDAGGSLSSSYSGPPSSLPLRQTPKRRNTDEASVLSDQSDGPVRRSAMRRSSSSSKAQSPRRVRFEFAGKEFPTTSSPAPAAPFLIPTNASPIPLEDSDDEAGASQVEDIEDSTLPPKRISSSQALRALSRGPIEDDGTRWDEVVAPADGSASVSIEEANLDSDDEEFLNMSRKKSVARPSSTHVQKTRESETETSAQMAIEAEEADDVLAEMAPVQATRFNRSQASTASSAETSISSSARPASLPLLPEIPNGDPANYDEDDDLFDFEDSVTNFRSNARRIDSTSESETEVENSPPSSPPKPVTLSGYSSSPGRPIIRHSPSSPTRNVSSSLKNSYHPFNTPIVSEAMHAKAASIGNLNSFVGSVNGASGMDESDARSFRASIGVGSFSQGFSLGGTPRSLSERMMLEDFKEEERILNEKV